MSNNSFKLYYFNARGAAEVLRLVFAYAGVEYEDIRIEGEQWPDRKDEMPQKMMPCLEVGGKKFCQSYAILRYLGREFGLYGANNMDSLIIDEIGETFVDMTKGLGALFSEKDEDKKREGMKKIVTETFPRFVPFICKRLNDNGTGFIAGNKMTIGDLILYRTMDFLKDFIGGCVSDYDPYWGQSELKKHYEMVENDPKIKAWINKRPVTKM